MSETWLAIYDVFACFTSSACFRCYCFNNTSVQVKGFCFQNSNLFYMLVDLIVSQYQFICDRKCNPFLKYFVLSLFCVEVDGLNTLLYAYGSGFCVINCILDILYGCIRHDSFGYLQSLENRVIIHWFMSNVSLLFLFFLFVLQAAPVNIIVGSHVWVEDPVLAWIDGEVTQLDGQDVHVNTTNGKKVSAHMPSA